MANLPGWPWWKVISITGQSGAGTDYQVELEIGDSAGGDFHLEGHCTNFPQDIRITDDDGTTLLDHWVEDLTADPIVVHVKVNDNLDSNQDIRVYYGKSGETTVSSISNTFIFGDDIESGNLNAWSGATAAYGAVGAAAHTGSYGIDRTQVDGSWQYLTGSGNIQNGIWEYWVREGHASSYPGIKTRYLGGSNMVEFSHKSTTDEMVINDVGGNGLVVASVNIVINQWFFVRVTLNGTSAKMEVYDSSMTLLQTLEHTVADRTGAHGVDCYRDAQFDRYTVRKYNSPEPAFSSAGAEQSAAGAPTGVFYGPLIGPFGGPI